MQARSQGEEVGQAWFLRLSCRRESRGAAKTLPELLLLPAEPQSAALGEGTSRHSGWKLCSCRPRAGEGHLGWQSSASAAPQQASGCPNSLTELPNNIIAQVPSLVGVTNLSVTADSNKQVIVFCKRGPAAGQAPSPARQPAESCLHALPSRGFY